MTTTTTEHRGPAIEIDESRWPLVRITFRGIAQDDEFDAYLAAADRNIACGERLVIVVDARRSGAAPPVQRKKQAEWQRRNADLLRSNVLGTVFAIDSSLIRGVLTAVLWLAPLPHPYHVAATLDDAERWAIEKLRAAGLPAPNALRLQTTS